MSNNEITYPAPLSQSITNSVKDGCGLNATLCGTPFVEISNTLEQLGWKPINARLQLSRKRPIIRLYDFLVSQGCTKFVVFYNCEHPNQEAILTTCETEEDSEIILNILDKMGKPYN